MRLEALLVITNQDLFSSLSNTTRSEPAFVPDIGIAASKDIASLEAATLDLINKASGLPYSIAEKYNLKAGDDKFRIIHGKDPYIQVRALEKLGLGSAKYNLIEV